MALINYAKREINLKIVYYGPAFSGKTTCIQYIYDRLDPRFKGKLITLATEYDRTLFFDFLPMELGEIRGFKVRIHLYTVPGQVYYNASRRIILRGADGIVFVADSQKERRRDNIISMENLKSNLSTYGLTLHDIPYVLMYNKRDLANILSREELDHDLNIDSVPTFESIAIRGIGVLESLKSITKSILKVYYSRSS